MLTRHMLQASVRRYFNWAREGPRVALAVNVAPHDLPSRDLVPSLEALLHTWAATRTGAALKSPRAA